MKKQLQVTAFVRFIKHISFLQVFLIGGISNFSDAHNLMAQKILEEKVSLQFEKTNLQSVLATIEKVTGAMFVYQTKLISNEKVSIHLVDQTLDVVLNDILLPLGITYEADGDHIVLSGSKAGITSATRSLTIPATGNVVLLITGTITDQSDGSPLPGVNIYVQGTTNGTTSDSNGKYAISVPDSSAILVFSYVGYTTEEILINKRTLIDVGLVPDLQSLGEVVVVGYGVQKKLTTVGAQSSVSVSELKQPVANLSNSIAGRIAGVIGVQRSGEPGYDNSEIYIRGISSFANSGSNPLILVDGVERTFNNIDPQDIESFSILKDASATAVYGVRGGNGVILINTKKGQTGKPKISFQYNQGITQFTRLPKFVDGVTYMQIANEARKNSNPELPPFYSNEAIEATRTQSDPDLYPNVNWFNEIFNKTGQNRRINFNVNGGSEKAKYYLSLGYYDEQGLFKNDDIKQYASSIGFKRYNFTSNLSLDVTNSTKIDFGASGFISDGNYPGSSTEGIFSSAYVLPPVVHPAKYSDGKIAQQRTGDINNPYNLLTQTGYVAETKSQIWSNIRVTQQFDALVKGLSATAMFSFDNYNSYKTSRTKSVDRWLATGRDAEGNLLYDGNAPVHLGSNVLGYSRDNGGNRQAYLESSINYVNNFDKHEVSGMVLYNQTDRVNGFADNFTTSIPYRFNGLAGRVTYAYDQRYMFEGNFGYNGSEAFAPGNRYGFFPSAGIGWVASNEAFFRPLERYIQFLKIRLSHGIVGNAVLTGSGQRFAYLSTVFDTNADYVFGRTQDNRFDALDIEYYAANVQWETSTKSNLGIELNALKDALSVTVDFFRAVRSDIYLVRGDMPEYAGVRNNPTGNLGEIFNHGVDGTIEYKKNFGNDFSVGIRGNFTWNRATVINDANAEWPYPWQQRIGRKLGQRFGYTAEGLFKSEEEIANSAMQTGIVKPGDIKYKDLNSDGVINSYDISSIGYGSFPEIVYGFGPTISYKGWSIGAFFKGIGNVDIMLNGEGLVPFQQGVGTRGNLLTSITDRWTQENPNPHPFYPRLSDGANNMNYVESTWWIRNGSYVRLQNVELSYNFSKRPWFDKVGLNNLRVYFIGYNLATFSKFKLWDVELGDGRGSNYPLIKTYSIGIDCKF
jgi:TonB-linked SusC/RagA family outer membrane protein